MSVLNNSLPSGRELVEVRRQLALQHAADRAFDSAVRRLPWLGGKHGQRFSENLANKDCFQEEYDNATPWAVALSNDAFEVHGDIRILFNQIGGGTGLLGCPLTDETTTRDGRGSFNNFQIRAIYWTIQTKA
ncbi:LGFP [Fusarium oxysporum f. sp. vasinfectum]|uniref:Uncharacterized protein n=1 Tax=Fusarium oxysporum f. sp. vasinfectum 25433 TaxID=1089449 RepID=X0LAF2_FUSOX|nr:hypothetical protein FOTG_13945 [Fusarium oxysporum f. sp. vasinfectum 25433]KAK2680317.1 LGFP [Fusarium oxysporum f. sp. vasinfectum]KAK2935162.1 LGFP [Fusarium oxysporum f. sp. vasinfectum]